MSKEKLRRNRQRACSELCSCVRPNLPPERPNDLHRSPQMTTLYIIDISVFLHKRGVFIEVLLFSGYPLYYQYRGEITAQ
jgi:hypothetical protein